jgi:hypothetical protein
MSKDSIRSLLEDKGSFPGKNDIRAGFEALFALAGTGQETVDDLAWGFQQALDQWSHVDAVVEPATAQRLHDWVQSQWTTSPYERCVRLCTLLANLPSPEVLAFLEAQRAAAAEPQIQRLLDRVLEDMRGKGRVAADDEDEV